MCFSGAYSHLLFTNYYKPFSLNISNTFPKKSFSTYIYLTSMFFVVFDSTAEVLSHPSLMVVKEISFEAFIIRQDQQQRHYSMTNT